MEHLVPVCGFFWARRAQKKPQTLIAFRSAEGKKRSLRKSYVYKQLATIKIGPRRRFNSILYQANILRVARACTWDYVGAFA